MTGGVKDFIRGGQVAKNQVIMFSQNIKMSLIPTLTIVTVLSLCCFFIFTDNYERYLWWEYISAEVAVESNAAHIPVDFKYPDGTAYKVFPQDIISSVNVRGAHEKVSTLIDMILLVALLISVVSVFSVNAYLTRKGEKLAEERVIDGLRPFDNQQQLIDMVRSENKRIGYTERYHIFDIPLYNGSELQHIGISGNTGQGKTQTILPLVKEIRGYNDKAIIYDKARAFVSYFYNADNDIILNPLDSRSPDWNIHAEATDATHYDAIAEAMIPLPKGQEPYWSLAARTIFSKTALRFAQAREYRMRPLLLKLYSTTLEEMAAMLQGTEAGALLDMNNPKTGESIRSVMSTYIKCLGYCKDNGVLVDPDTGIQDKSRLFSITEWVKNDERRGFIFITVKGEHSATLKPLITTFYNVAIVAGMSLSPSKTRRLFVMMDELPSINKLPALTSGAAELRQFGFSFVLGWQLYSQLEEVWGTSGAQTVSGLLNTRIQFNPGTEPANVKHASEQFGSYTVLMPDEGYSFGVGVYRDGANLKYKEDKRACVTPSAISIVPPLNGFIRLAGGMFPVSPFSVPYHEPDTIAKDLIDRPLEELALGDMLVISDMPLDLDKMIQDNIAANNARQGALEKQRRDSKDATTKKSPKPLVKNKVPVVDSAKPGSECEQPKLLPSPEAMDQAIKPVKTLSRGVVDVEAAKGAANAAKREQRKPSAIDDFDLDL
ncbi:type IV secretion system DNA-binding domain-containing protein [Enterovibrio paralichthyis]|uniref:type IV secretion system DNA-binding domain-containing protein n=1 Tax=Enterovibrio paralichthyis TaxID=2853805 RepID=UPI001C476051|nr:type IV secretion system DNA-binding domain-containing protein [Enterovibrio paralichthyis]MBV7300286.1 type IV secretion system DNA-binding domain-containing protein [Enterovibrio paralichthyis]